MLYYRRSRFLRLVVLPLTLLAFPSACHKWVPPEVGPGVRLRISAPELSSKRLVGAVESVVGDTLVLKLDKGDAISTVPFTAVERIDVSRGSIPGNTAFIVAGGVIGLGIGIAEAARINSDEDCESASVQGLWCSLAWFIAPPAFAVIGSIAGWLVSAPFFRIEGWEKVPPEYLRVSIYPANGGIALAFSVEF